MIDIFFLQGLKRDPRLLENFILPGQQLGAEIIALALVHERLFFGGSIVFQLFQGQPICAFLSAAFQLHDHLQHPLTKFGSKTALINVFLATLPALNLPTKN